MIQVSRVLPTLAAMSLPLSQLALFTTSPVPEYTIRTHPVPSPAPGEVLIKVKAVAINPTDWKFVAFRVAPPGNGVGNDYSGTVVALGEGSHGVAVGDRVAGRMAAGRDKRNFSFQEYLATRSDLLIKIPNNVSFEDASTVPLTATMAALGLQRLVGFPERAESGKTVFVSGGTSCIGMYVCQFAKFAGLRVIASASPKNFDLVRSLGASSVIDYRAPDALQQILDAAGTSGVDYVFDAISMGDSVHLTSKVLMASPHGEKKAAFVLPINPSFLDPAVEYYPISVNTIYNTLVPRSVSSIFQATRSDYETALTTYKHISLWLEEGKLKPSPVTLKPGGLNGIPEGLALMKAGKVSGTKLVYRIANTDPSPSV